MIYVLLKIFLTFSFSEYLRMYHLKHQKYKSKRSKNSTLESENNFNLINISVNDMDKFEKKKLTKKKTLTENAWWG